MLTPVLTVNIVWLYGMYGMSTPVLTVNIVWYVNTSTNSKHCMVCQHQY